MSVSRKVAIGFVGGPVRIRSGPASNLSESSDHVSCPSDHVPGPLDHVHDISDNGPGPTTGMSHTHSGYVVGEFCVGLYGWFELRNTVYTLSTLLSFSKNGIKSKSSESVISSNHDATGTWNNNNSLEKQKWYKNYFDLFAVLH